jgi:phenolic acid decarboxylase
MWEADSNFIPNYDNSYSPAIMYKNITTISYKCRYHIIEKLSTMMYIEDENFNIKMIHNTAITPELIR